MAVIWHIDESYESPSLVILPRSCCYRRRHPPVPLGLPAALHKDPRSARPLVYGDGRDTKDDSIRIDGVLDGGTSTVLNDGRASIGAL